jgi:cytoskeletal protein CcmA (bactofilin family)
MSTSPAEANSSRSQLSSGSRVKGELSFPGFVEVHGAVEGRVSAASIMIEQDSRIEGELTADHIWIRGQVEGRINGGAVTLHSSARVSGDVHYDTLSVDSGAEVNIACKRRKQG